MKASTRRTRDGQAIRYLQLAHNEWDPVAKASKTRVLYSFGRADHLDVAGIRRLVDALSRLLDPADALAAAAPAGLSFTESRPLGGAGLLDGLWRRLRIDTVLRPLVGSARREVDVERVLVALVANLLDLVEEAILVWDDLSGHLHDAYHITRTDPEEISQPLVNAHHDLCEHLDLDAEEIGHRLTRLIELCHHDTINIDTYTDLLGEHARTITRPSHR